MADLLYEYWSAVEESLLEFWYMTITPVFDEINDIVSQYDFLPLLGVCLWHVDLVVVPTLTRFVFSLAVCFLIWGRLRVIVASVHIGCISKAIATTNMLYSTKKCLILGLDDMAPMCIY